MSKSASACGVDAMVVTLEVYGDAVESDSQ